MRSSQQRLSDSLMDFLRADEYWPQFDLSIEEVDEFEDFDRTFRHWLDDCVGRWLDIQKNVVLSQNSFEVEYTK
ncbi:MAG: hypothetical protein P4M14_12550 [Gammaproteobacteria bacterium]|nr:hypothetical protein [Gammaproteobacteria bacterium]